MSNYEPTKAYVYQPDRPYNRDGTENKRIYALAGPRSEAFCGFRFTKEEADTILSLISDLETCIESLEYYSTLKIGSYCLTSPGLDDEEDYGEIAREALAKIKTAGRGEE